MRRSVSGASPFCWAHRWSGLRPCPCLITPAWVSVLPPLFSFICISSSCLILSNSVCVCVCECVLAPDAAHSDFKVRSRSALRPPPPRIFLRFALESHALPPTSLRIQSDFLPLGPARGPPSPVSLSLLLLPSRDTSNITRANLLHPCTSDLGTPPVLSFPTAPRKRSGSSIANLAPRAGPPSPWFSHPFCPLFCVYALSHLPIFRRFK